MNFADFSTYPYGRPGIQNMRLIIFFSLIAISSDVLAENGSADDSIAGRAKALLFQYHCDPGSLHHRLQDYFLASRADDEWSSRAAVRLSDWLEADDNSDEVAVACKADICTVDFHVPFSQYASRFGDRVEEWDQAKHAGFLPESVSFPKHDGSTRLFIFRDSFDPEAL